MRRKLRCFFAWDFEREEKWINRLSQEKGLHLKKVGFCRYTFEEGVPGAYEYRLEHLRRTARDEAAKQALITIGAEEVCRNGDWSYYRIDRRKGHFPLYTCADSKLRHLKSIRPTYLAFGAAVYLSIAMNFIAYAGVPPTAVRVVVFAALLAIAFGYTVGLTRLYRAIRRMERRAAEEDHAARR